MLKPAEHFSLLLSSLLLCDLFDQNGRFAIEVNVLLKKFVEEDEEDDTSKMLAAIVEVVELISDAVASPGQTVSEGDDRGDRVVLVR